MNIFEMHYDFDVKIDKVNSLQKRSFNQAQKDWLLHEAHWVFLKRNYGLVNPTREGFEVTEHRIQDLKNLHIKSPGAQAALVPTQVSVGYLEVNLGDLTFEHFVTTRLRAKISQGNCSKIVSVSVTQTDDLNDSLIDPFNQPSWKNETVLAVYGRSTTPRVSIYNPEGTGSVYLYTDGTFNVDEVYIDYIKHPNRVWIGTYDLTDNLRPKDISNNYVYQSGVDAPVSSDLNVHTHPEIVDIAVALASEMIEDPNLIRLKQQKTTTNK